MRLELRALSEGHGKYVRKYLEFLDSLSTHKQRNGCSSDNCLHQIHENPIGEPVHQRPADICANQHDQPEGTRNDQPRTVQQSVGAIHRHLDDVDRGHCQGHGTDEGIPRQAINKEEQRAEGAGTAE